MANRYKNEPFNTPEQKLEEARNKIESLETFKKEAMKLLKRLEKDTHPDEYKVGEFLKKHGGK